MDLPRLAVFTFALLVHSLETVLLRPKITVLKACPIMTDLGKWCEISTNPTYMVYTLALQF